MHNILLLIWATKKSFSENKDTDLSVSEKYFFPNPNVVIYTEGADLASDQKIVMFSTLRLPFIVTMSTACVRRAACLVRALAGIYLARPDWLLTVAWTEGNQRMTGTRSWSPRNRMLGRGDN